MADRDTHTNSRNMFVVNKSPAILLVVFASLVPCWALTAEEKEQFYNGVVIGEGNPNYPNYRVRSSGIPEYEYEPISGNNNQVLDQQHVFIIPKTATPASEIGCLGDPVGVAVNGVPFYNPLNRRFEDLVEGKRFDFCDGHPANNDDYHYHSLPLCLMDAATGRRDVFLGVAMDGYPIYGPYDGDDNLLTSADLDECHGRVSTNAAGYEYRATYDFPYIIGCYHGNTAADEQPSSTCYYAANKTSSSGGGAGAGVRRRTNSLDYLLKKVLDMLRE